MLNNSSVFNNVSGNGIILNSVEFKYICLSRFVNVMNKEVDNGTAKNMNLNVDVEDDSFYASFDLEGKRGTIVFECSKFIKFIIEKGFKRRSMSEIDKALKEYVSNLILVEFSKYIK